MYTGPVIDACTFHDWQSITEFGPYLSGGWHEALIRPTSIAGPNEFRNAPLYRSPVGKTHPAAMTPGRRPGTDIQQTLEQLFADGRRECTVLGYDDALLSLEFGNEQAVRPVVQAANDWTIDTWLSADPRLTALALIQSSVPESAAAELRRIGTHDQIVGVAMGLNGLGMPFGHPVYHPIYEAASELDLPLVIQVGSDTGVSLLAAPIGGGVASTTAEVNAWGAHPLMSHLSSMIFDGIFDYFPKLKVLLVGGGASWVPSFIWRLDFWYNNLHWEAPTLQGPPSEYFKRHARVSTYQLEAPAAPGRLTTALSTVPWIDDILIYAGGYPNLDWLEPAENLVALPAEWQQKVLHDNAADFFRLPAVVDAM